jgi:hypothetical protein
MYSGMPQEGLNAREVTNKMDRNSGDHACGHCGKVYNPYIGDRFWSGHFPCTRASECKNDGGLHDTLCNSCHRQMVRE